MPGATASLPPDVDAAEPSRTSGGRPWSALPAGSVANRATAAPVVSRPGGGRGRCRASACASALASARRGRHGRGVCGDDDRRHHADRAREPLVERGEPAARRPAAVRARSRRRPCARARRSTSISCSRSVARLLGALQPDRRGSPAPPRHRRGGGWRRRARSSRSANAASRSPAATSWRASTSSCSASVASCRARALSSCSAARSSSVGAMLALAVELGLQLGDLPRGAGPDLLARLLEPRRRRDELRVDRGQRALELRRPLGHLRRVAASSSSSRRMRTSASSASRARSSCSEAYSSETVASSPSTRSSSRARVGQLAGRDGAALGGLGALALRLLAGCCELALELLPDLGQLGCGRLAQLGHLAFGLLARGRELPRSLLACGRELPRSLLARGRELALGLLARLGGLERRGLRTPGEAAPCRHESARRPASPGAGCARATR